MHNLFLQILFYGLAIIAILSGFMVITQNNPVRSALFLVLTFVVLSIIWMIAEAEFLSLILVLVYVGAVMTLFLFVVMMLNIDVESRKSYLRHLPFGLILVALLTGLLLISLPNSIITGAVEQNTTMLQTASNQQQHIKLNSLPNTEQIGLVLYTNYVFALEIAAALLLVAIIASITLSHRESVNSKRQNIVQQVMTNKRDRITLMSLEAEK